MIRQLTSSDNDIVEGHLKDVATHYPDVYRWYQRHWADPDRSRIGYCIFSGDLMIGFILLKVDFHDLKISTLWIHPDHRQRSHGSRLLAYACDVLNTFKRPYYIEIKSSQYEEFSTLLMNAGFTLVTSMTIPSGIQYRWLHQSTI